MFLAKARHFILWNCVKTGCEKAFKILSLAIFLAESKEEPEYFKRLII